FIDEFTRFLDAALPSGVTNPQTQALYRILGSGASWLAIPAEKFGFAAEMSIDRAILIPFLGCMVEGWIISPVKEVAQLRLRIGSAILNCAPKSLYWKPRGDLCSAFPGYGPL